MSVCDAAPRGPQTSRGIWCFPGQMPHNQCTGAPGPCLQLRPLTGLSLTVTTTVRISALHNIRVSALHNIRVAPRYGRCWVLQGNLIHLPRRQVSSGKFRAALILKMADVTYRPFTVGVYGDKMSGMCTYSRARWSARESEDALEAMQSPMQVGTCRNVHSMGFDIDDKRTPTHTIQVYPPVVTHEGADGAPGLPRASKRIISIIMAHNHTHHI